jgi:hypothetical protein
MYVYPNKNLNLNIQITAERNITLHEFVCKMGFFGTSGAF